VTEAILSSRHRNALAVHNDLVAVAESMEPAALYLEFFEQGIELSFPNQVRIPRRSARVIS
jgi:hypothetical protein